MTKRKDGRGRPASDRVSLTVRVSRDHLACLREWAEPQLVSPAHVAARILARAIDDDCRKSMRTKT